MRTDLPRTVVVTGANSGIGLALAHEIAGRGDTVVMACRNIFKASAARTEILRRTHGARVDVLPLDLASLADIRKFATTLEGYGPIDALVNNAGTVPLSPQSTPDGFEMQFGVNYLGAFLLTHLVLPQLRTSAARTGDARIVHVSSGAHLFGTIEPHTFRSRDRYRPFAAYAQSKLANLMFSNALARRLPPEIGTHAVHPGAIDSEIWRELPRPLYRLLQLGLASPAKAARLGADVALEETFRGRSGGYHAAQRPRGVSSAARDIDKQELLYAQSCALAGVDPLPHLAADVRSASAT